MKLTSCSLFLFQAQPVHELVLHVCLILVFADRLMSGLRRLWKNQELKQRLVYIHHEKRGILKHQQLCELLVQFYLLMVLFIVYLHVLQLHVYTNCYLLHVLLYVCICSISPFLLLYMYIFSYTFCSCCLHDCNTALHLIILPLIRSPFSFWFFAPFLSPPSHISFFFSCSSFSSFSISFLLSFPYFVLPLISSQTQSYQVFNRGRGDEHIPVRGR